ncbi:amino acid adenylation domain-containing protein [Streptomyces sp. NPDC039022]|uniref:amino acid adenylation domain-containing protein n=1 Tax=Streptomyces sp. NPDC039022 TaxID=3157091 RepID=UPI0033C24769
MDGPSEHEDALPAIAVTGMACRFPGAESAAHFWELLRDGIAPHEHVPHDELRRAGLLDRALGDPSYVAERKGFADPALFDAAYFGMPPAEARITDPQQRFLLETAVHALEDAGLAPSAGRDRIGVFVGLNHSDYLLRHVLGHPEAVEALGWHRVLMGNDRGFAATGLSYRLGLTGPSIAVDCACASSLAAVHQACRALLDYEADAALAGGAGIMPEELGYVYEAGGIASPDGRCLPFSDEAQGTVFASGVGLVVLRRLEDALQDGDRVLAVIRAGGMNNDGPRKSGFTAPSTEGQAELIAYVHQLAGVTADQVSYVEAHGTATVLGDPIEVSALTEAFRETTDATGFCAIGSVKSNIGHLDSASGIAGLIKVVLALRHRTLPPTLGCERTNPHIHFAGSPFHVQTRTLPWTAPGPLLAGVSSFGVGGTNVHLLVEEAPAVPQAERKAVPDHLLLPFSATSPRSLHALEARLRERVATADPDDVRDVAFTLSKGREVHPLRRALLWRAHHAPLLLDGEAPPADRGQRMPAFLLRHDVWTLEALRSLWEHQPAFRETTGRLISSWATARGTTVHDALTDFPRQAPEPLVNAVVTLGCSAVWATHGIRPGAVIAEVAARPAAAVLTGALPEDALATALAASARETSWGHVLRDAELSAVRVPWYDPDGAQLCSAGRVPDGTTVFTGRPAAPGQRTLTPPVSAIVTPAPGAAPPRSVPPNFADAVLGAVPQEARPGHEALLAALGRAWVLGLPVDPRRVTPADGGRITELPLYPFDRQRYWLAAHPQQVPPPPAPVPAPAAAVAPASHRTESTDEQAACAIFARALGHDDVSLDDDLFALGGDSLLATRIAALAGARWQRAVPLGSFLRNPSPRRLARLMHTAGPGTAERSEAAPRATEPAPGQEISLPVGPLQERFLFLSEIPGAAQSYNVPVLADLRGPLDVAALSAALTDVVARHESLRVRFRRSGGRPEQVIVPDVAVDLPLVDVPDEEALSRQLTELIGTTIPLDRAPTFVARLLRTAPDRHVLALVLHHIGADAHSTGILLRDLYTGYARRTGGGPPPQPIDGMLDRYLQLQARWLRSEEADRQRRFWRDALADLPDPLELPSDRSPGAQRTHQGDAWEFKLPATVSRAVGDYAGREGVTSFVVVLTAFVTLLSKIGNQGDFVIGIPVSGRHRPETRDLIGNFVNTLPFRARIAADRDVRSLLQDTAERLTSALDHQDLPFEMMLQELGTGSGRHRAPDGASVFPVLFNVLSRRASVPEPPAGLQARPVAFARTTSPYPLSLDCWFDEDGALAGRFLYDTDRFDRETVAAWQEGFAHVLGALMEHPTARISAIPAEPPEAAALAASSLTGPAVDVPELPVHAVFARWAGRVPERLAVTDGRSELMYGQLAEVSAGIAGLLRSHGVETASTVGLAMRRGVPLVAALLGVLRAGATPVPFDLDHPRQRLTAMAEDCGAEVVLCEHAADAEFAQRARAVAVPDLTAFLGSDPAAPGDTAVGETGAYVTYTSGTTGTPKGIHFPHRALANLIHWETEGHTRARRWLQLASYGFDAAFHETFAALCAGGSLHIADEETKQDHDALARFVDKHQVEKAIVPVSLLHALAARFRHDADAFASLREIASTGEQLEIGEHVLAFFEARAECQLINNYGPAETHVVTSHRFHGPPGAWPRRAPVGRPIQNTVLRIVGKDGQPVPRGTVGELSIGGVCVATGYLGRPELTEERFGHRADSGRVYRSGDLVRLPHSGDVEFLGRGDRQVKIRGVRVEPAEIELAVREDPDILDVALVVRGAAGDRRIDAYLVTAPDATDVVRRTRARLRERLPAAMVPASFTTIDRMPTNVNGKVDPARLPAPGSRPGGEPDPCRTHPDSGVLPQVLDAFREALDRPGLGPEEDFFDAGGHSLLATRLVHAVRERFGIPLAVTEFYTHGTAARLADLVARRWPTEDPPREEELPETGPPDELPPGLRVSAREPSGAQQKTYVFDAGQRLDEARLRAALRTVLHRYPALRLKASPDARVSVSGPELPAVEVRRHRLPAGVTSQHTSAWLYERAQQDPVDPGSGLLLRTATADGPDGQTLLALTVHLLALDGIGLTHVCRALAEAYADSDARPRPDHGFARYLTWRTRLDGDRLADAAALWRRLLPSDVTATDRTPPVAARVTGQLSWAPGEELQQVLRTRCTQHRVTPFVLHLTAFALALSWAEERTEVCLSVPLDGRPHASLAASVGAFANVVPVPLPLSGAASLDAALASVRDVIDQVLLVRTMPYTDLAASDAHLAEFAALPVVMNYIRDEDEVILLNDRPLREVGPVALAPGQRVQFSVVDTATTFRAVLTYRPSAVEESDARLLALYRHAVYALSFETGTSVCAAKDAALCAVGSVAPQLRAR